MNIWESTVLTDKGTALQAKLVNGQTLYITKVMTGGAKVPMVNLRQQTSVTDGGREITLQPVRVEGDQTILPVLLENTGLEEGYDLWQVGIYAQDPDEGEILYCIAQASEAKHIPSATEGPGFSITWDFYFKTSNTAPFDVNLNSVGLINIEQYQVHTGEINSLKSSVVSLDDRIEELNADLDTVKMDINDYKKSFNMKLLPVGKTITESIDASPGNYFFNIPSYGSNCDMPGNENYAGFVLFAGAKYTQLLCFGNLSGKLYTRIKINGVWKAWTEK